MNYKAIKNILSKMPSYCFSCTNTNDKMMKGKEGGKKEKRLRMEEGMDGGRFNKKQQNPRQYFLQESYI